MPTAEADRHHMRAALGLARRGLGCVWPNPAVGCVIVRDGRVVGRGWTQPGGRPHAETEALRRAGEAAHGATAYVTLEPCAHHGQTGPCAAALIEAGIARAVVAVQDPDPRVDGGGLKMLRDAGIAVEIGVLEAAAEEVNAGFLMRVTRGRPLVAWKAATTLDGRIATHAGESRWITGEAARRAGHMMRASHDAILVGSGTALSDDPELTCRIEGLEDRTPVRVVVDGRLRLPLTHKLVSGARAAPTWMMTLAADERGQAERRDAYRAAGVEVIEGPADADGNPDMAVALRALGERGITRLLVEGGGRIAAALMRARLIDRVTWFRAPALIGGDGVPAIAGFGVDRMVDVPRLVRASASLLGDDAVETYIVGPDKG
jgi:diaminohydroxyphosphoribosylaminopyrimidine deaminase/5-amino-6-(5-phosphoribosylamino)uracil reductase